MHFLIKQNTSAQGESSRYCFVLLISLVFVLLVQNVRCDNAPVAEKDLTNLERLRAQLFTNYDKNAQPMHRGEPTKITLRLTVNYFDIDELSGKVTLHTWVAMGWKDDNRSWNSSEYGNITSIHNKPREVWKPDIQLFNSAGDGNFVGETLVLLFSDGSFLYVPPATYVAYCSLNLLMWPYDQQTCSLKLGTLSLSYIDTSELMHNDTLNTDEAIESTEWEIVSTSFGYFSKSYYNYIEFSFTMQRRSHMYGAVIFTPATCIILLTLATFWLPPQMGEKILLNGITIVIIAAFLMYFAQLLPIMAENTPLIVLFYSSSLLMLSISTIIAVIVLYLSTAKHKRRVPDILKKQLNGRLGSILLLAHFTLEAENNAQSSMATNELGEQVFEDAHAEANDLTDPLGINTQTMPSGRAIQFDWILLATAIDRLCFLSYSFVFLILAIVDSV